MLAGFGKLNVDEVGTKLKRIKSATWDLLLLSKIIDPRTIVDQENLGLLRRYLPNAYIRSKATCPDTQRSYSAMVIHRGVKIAVRLG